MVFCFQCFLRPMNREEKNANKSGFIKFQVHFAVGCSRRKKCARSKFRMETKWKIEGKNSVDFSPVFLFSSMDSCVQKIYKYTSSIYSVEKFFRFWLGIFFLLDFFSVVIHQIRGLMQLTREKSKLKETFALCTDHFGFVTSVFHSHFLFFIFFFARFLYLSQPFHWNRSMCNAVHCIQCVPIRLCMRVSLSLGVYVVVLFLSSSGDFVGDKWNVCCCVSNIGQTDLNIGF